MHRVRERERERQRGSENSAPLTHYAMPAAYILIAEPGPDSTAAFEAEATTLPARTRLC